MFNLKKSLVALIAVLLITFFSAGVQSESGASVGTSSTTCPNQSLQNAGFELWNYPSPRNWNTSFWSPSAQLVHDNTTRHFGFSSARITAATANDAWFWQEVTVEPNAFYLLSGWIKTENVSGGAGANLSLVGTWTHTQGLFGTNNWTRVSLWFNSGSSTRITIGARLGYWASTSSGTAWFDDLRLTRITPDGPHPRWKILVLIYDKTDAVVTDTAGVPHHMVGAMTPDEVERATLAATQFVETDIPVLTSGNMIPELTIRYPDHPLTQLDPFSYGWSPSPANTASDRDPAFDSVIVIWDPRVIDQYTGTRHWMAAAGGLATPMGAGQTYAAIIIEIAGRNTFKHEWGHSILFFFDAIGASPKPAVSNHDDGTTYVHWPTGESYMWVDETDANPIPNSIYNNESGFTHDYYSGTVATADQPTRRLGITPEAWMLGGPVTKPDVPSGPPPVIACNGDIVVPRYPGSCSAIVTLTPPAASDACDSDLTIAATRSDGADVWALYPCGQTVVTWSVTNSENLTSTCPQVVTVTDEKPPVFIHVPPPVTVNTGPGATSCGAVVDDTSLGSTAPGLNPVMLDPIGDVRDPSSSLQNDVISTAATFDNKSITFTVSFAEQIFPPSSSNPRRLRGSIDIDTDQNPAIGWHSLIDTMGPTSLNLGVDFQINLSSESIHPGLVEVQTRVPDEDTSMGTVPIRFSDTSFSVTVPLALLGGDDGFVNYAVGVGLPDIYPTDRVPNGAVPLTSVPVPELIAMDNCAGVTISRTGVPASSLFPVGETLITYTATDVSGNAVSVTQTVTVIDNTPPVISQVAASPSILWPPNHDMVDVTVTYEATDNCAIRESWLSVRSNQPGGGSSSDWVVVDAHHVRLRAARSGRWGERLYTVAITAKDIHGNLSTQNIIVRVPQSMGQRGAKL